MGTFTNIYFISLAFTYVYHVFHALYTLRFNNLYRIDFIYSLKNIFREERSHILEKSVTTHCPILQ